MNMTMTGILSAVTMATAFTAGAVDVHVSVSAANILGIKHTAGATDAPNEVAIGVPWVGVSLTNESVTVDRLVATGLCTNDTLKAFDDATRRYLTWTWNGSVWVQATSTDPNAPVVPAASEYRVDRGTALWLVRSNPTNAFAQVGQYTADLATTKICNTHDSGATGTTASPVYNLLFSPVTNSFDLAALKLEQGCKTGDRVYVPTLSKNYSFRGASIDGWGEQVGRVWQKCVQIEIPAGTAFWYLSAGGNPTIAW